MMNQWKMETKQNSNQKRDTIWSIIIINEKGSIQQRKMGEIRKFKFITFIIEIMD